MKSNILYAVLYKISGRGQYRNWTIFRFHDFYQSEIENCMLLMGYDCRKYFLQEPKNFIRDNEMKLLKLKSSRTNKYYWCMDTDIRIKRLLHKNKYIMES